MSDIEYQILRQRSNAQKVKELWNGYELQNKTDHKSVVEEYRDRTILGKFCDAQDWLVGEISKRLGLSCEMVEKAIKGN